MTLDEIDRGILLALQNHARISNKELAAANGISPSTCLARVRRLQETGVITAFRTEINPMALGLGVQAMIAVRLSKHARVSFDVLRDSLLDIPEVMSVYLLGGAQDFLVHVAVRDVVHLREVIVRSFTSREDVSHVETSLIFEYARSPVIYWGPEGEGDTPRAKPSGGTP